MTSPDLHGQQLRFLLNSVPTNDYFNSKNNNKKRSYPLQGTIRRSGGCLYGSEQWQESGQSPVDSNRSRCVPSSISKLHITGTHGRWGMQFAARLLAISRTYLQF
ncbi:Uncharacterized protein APZ42_017297 [Daphnia magna]|uniref:Uncharacterized protein n=1 Tax=Daphnia magna TaxID=35525 RepID=A0A164ZSS1_9CRUS|nr:Uncharacterized protein APZ42_017297 [Daphnia magna]